MPTALEMSAGFDFDLRGLLPRLRTYALSLTRNRDRADDPRTANRAESPGSELRRARPTVDMLSRNARETPCWPTSAAVPIRRSPPVPQFRKAP